MDDAPISGASVEIRDILPPTNADSIYCHENHIFFATHSPPISHEGCMKMLQDARDTGATHIPLGNTSTDSNGEFELLILSGMSNYDIHVQGGVNSVTGEANDSTFTIDSNIGFHVNPASEMASALFKGGMSAEDAKQRVVDFINEDFENVDGLTKADLFEKSMSEDMKDRDARALKKGVAFNAINNVKTMLREAIEADLPEKEQEVVESAVITALANGLSNREERLHIDEWVDEAIQHIDSNEFELQELSHQSKRAIISNTVRQQHESLEQIDIESVEDNDFEATFSNIEIERLKVNEERSVIEQIVKVDISENEGNLEAQDKFLDEVRSNLLQEVEAAKTAREQLNFAEEADMIRRRASLHSEFEDIRLSIIDFQKEFLQYIGTQELERVMQSREEWETLNAHYNEIINSAVEMDSQFPKLNFETAIEKTRADIDVLLKTVFESLQSLLTDEQPGEGLDELRKEPIVGGGEIGGEPVEIVFPEELLILGPTDRWAKPGAIAKEGHYPLFRAPFGALQYAPEYHTHTFIEGPDQEVTYYMPEGLNMDPGPSRNGWHGDFPMEEWIGIPFLELPGEFPGDELPGGLPGRKEDQPIVEDLSELVVDVYKKISTDDLASAVNDIDPYFAAMKLDISFPTNEEEINALESTLESQLTAKYDLVWEWLHSDKFETRADFILFHELMERKYDKVIQDADEEGANQELVQQQYMAINHMFRGYFEQYYYPYKFNNSMPSLHRTLDALSHRNGSANGNIQNSINNYKNNPSSHWIMGQIGDYINHKWMYNKFYMLVQNRYNNLLTNIENGNHPNSGDYYAIPLSEMSIDNYEYLEGKITISVKSLSDYKMVNGDREKAHELFDAEEFVYILDSEHVVHINEDEILFKITDGIMTQAYDAANHLPGVVLRNNDLSDSGYNAGARRRVLFIGESCDTGYTLEPTMIGSMHGYYQTGHMIFEKPVSEYGMLIRYSYDRTASALQNWVSGVIYRGEDPNQTLKEVEEGYVNNSNIYYYMPDSDGVGVDYIDGAPGADGQRMPICGDYTLMDHKHGFYKTVTSTGPNRDELSDPLYAKYDTDIPYHRLYELVDGEYVPYTGLAYKKATYTGFNTAAMLQNSVYAETYIVLNGVFRGLNYDNSFGLTYDTRGYGDCSGTTRSNIFQVHTHWLLNSNYQVHKLLDGIEVVFKSTEGEEVSRRTIVGGEYNPFATDLANRNFLNNSAQYFIEVTFGDSGELIIQFTPKMKSWGFGQFGVPESDGRWNNQYFNCLDSDGDGYYDAIDFDPQDPNIYGDYDMDGLADNVDDFPFTPGMLYSIVKNLETDELFALNANVSDYPYFWIAIFAGEKGSGAQVYGFEFIETIITEPINGETIIQLDPSQNINVNLGTKESVLRIVPEARAKYNSKDGGKK